MLIDAGLVLEGGGTRCVFTAGLLDYFMEQELYIKHVYGVSASAYAAMNYLAKQRGRTKACNIDYIGKKKLFTWKSFFTTGSIMNSRLLFDIQPNQEIPFDYETFLNSHQSLTMSVSDLHTGKAVYFNKYKDGKHLMEICKNSNSFPVITPVQYINGTPVLDGGMADAIPIHKAFSDGVKRCIVVLTKPRGYRKKLKKSKLISFLYRNYPKFVDVVNKRPKMYNDTLDYIEQLEKQGDLFVIYPQVEPVRLVDRKQKKLLNFYHHGYEYGKEIYPQLLNFLQQRDQ